MSSQPSSAAAHSPPAPRDALESRPIGDAVGHRVVGERGVQGAIGPQPAPPFPLGRRLVQPHRRRRRDLGESGLPRPRLQQPAGGRLPRHGAMACADRPRATRRAPAPAGARSRPRSRRRAPRRRHRARAPDGTRAARRPDGRGAAAPDARARRRSPSAGRSSAYASPTTKSTLPIPRSAREGSGLRDDVGGGIQSRHATGRDALGELHRDRAGSGADVEDRESRPQQRGEVGGGVVDRPPGVRSQHALVVSVGVAARP